MNGTTNYILTQMELGMPYEKALSQAQALGYAEADLTKDVTGKEYTVEKSREFSNALKPIN
jgi:homoserine dehydrogenase